MNVSSYLIATSSSAASSPNASKSPWMSGVSGKPGSRMNLEASSFDAASASQVRLKDAYLGELKEEQQGNLTHEKEQISKETDDPESEPWYHFQEKQQNPFLQRFRKIKTIKKRHWNISLPYRLKQSPIRKPSTTWSGRSTEDHHTIL